MSCQVGNTPKQVPEKEITQGETEIDVEFPSPTTITPGTTDENEALPTGTMVSAPTRKTEPTQTRIITDDEGTSLYRGNLGRSGVYPGPGPESSPHLLWKFEAGDSIYSAPAFLRA